MQAAPIDRYTPVKHYRPAPEGVTGAFEILATLDLTGPQWRETLRDILGVPLQVTGSIGGPEQWLYHSVSAQALLEDYDWVRIPGHGEGDYLIRVEDVANLRSWT